MGRIAGDGTINGARLLRFTIIYLTVTSFFAATRNVRRCVFSGPAVTCIASNTVRNVLLTLDVGLPGFVGQV